MVILAQLNWGASLWLFYVSLRASVVNFFPAIARAVSVLLSSIILSLMGQRPGEGADFATEAS